MADQFDAACRRVLDGDESLRAARDLEAATLAEFGQDERLADLLEALADYRPEGYGLHCAGELLREQIRTTLQELAPAQSDDG
jgi:hypothetical protein